MRCLATLLLAAMPCLAGATDFDSVGYTSEPGEIIGGGLDECTGTLLFHHDETFENGYAWRYNGVAPPYYGSFGEGFAMGGNATIQCIALWLTQVGGYSDEICDVYIWEGGVTTEPGAVLSVLYDVEPGPPAIWPDISQHDVDIPDYAVNDGELTVGYWPNWPGGYASFYCSADLDGPGGNPWTCLAPASGYGTGWADPSVVWGPTESMGLGFYYDVPTPAGSATWGAVKRLFQ